MKKITFIFLALFFVVQVVPVFIVQNDDTTSVFITEEKNGEEKNETAENKDQKYFSQFSKISEDFSHDLRTAFHSAEKIVASPWLEKPTPPPNFC